MIAEMYLKKRYRDGMRENEAKWTAWYERWQAAWTAWRQRWQAAQERGEPFDEPPPNLDKP